MRLTTMLSCLIIRKITRYMGYAISMAVMSNLKLMNTETVRDYRQWLKMIEVHITKECLVVGLAGLNENNVMQPLLECTTVAGGGDRFKHDGLLCHRRHMAWPSGGPDAIRGPSVTLSQLDSICQHTTKRLMSCDSATANQTAVFHNCRGRGRRLL